MTTTTLELRETRTYRDAWSHLDRSRYLGVATVLQRSERVTDEEDPCEPTEIMLLVKVTLDRRDHSQPLPTEYDVRQALRDTFGGSRCTHEHDCCGCWSTHYGDVLQRSIHHPDEYVLIGHASRNY